MALASVEVKKHTKWLHDFLRSGSIGSGVKPENNTVKTYSI